MVSSLICSFTGGGAGWATGTGAGIGAASFTGCSSWAILASSAAIWFCRSLIRGLTLTILVSNTQQIFVSGGFAAGQTTKDDGLPYSGIRPCFLAGRRSRLV